MRSLRHASALPLAALLGCAGGDVAPVEPVPSVEYALPGVSARVEILRVVSETSAPWPVALPVCGAVALGRQSFDVDGEPSDALREVGDDGAPVGLADLDGDGLDDLVESSPTVADVHYHLATAPCVFRTQAIALGPPCDGIPRGLAAHGGDLYVGWAGAHDGIPSRAVARRFSRAGREWVEAPLEVPPAVTIGRTWGLWSYGGRLLLGLDAGEGWTTPALPANQTSWAETDAMGASRLRVGGLPFLLVSALPARNLALDEVGVDHAEEIGARGPLHVVTWGSATVDVNDDGLDDLVALAIRGENTSGGLPRVPRVLVQRQDGKLATVPVSGPALRQNWLACVKTTCAASGEGGSVLFRVSVTP